MREEEVGSWVPGHLPAARVWDLSSHPAVALCSSSSSIYLWDFRDGRGKLQKLGSSTGSMEEFALSLNV